MQALAGEMHAVSNMTHYAFFQERRQVPPGDLFKRGTHYRPTHGKKAHAGTRTQGSRINAQEVRQRSHEEARQAIPQEATQGQRIITATQAAA